MEPEVRDYLNAASIRFARQCWPFGFDVGPAADVDLAEPNLADFLREVNERGRLTVWSGASENTIFGEPEVNYHFRAWHDWGHWRYRLPFNLKGERAAAYVQVAHIARVYGDDELAAEMAAWVLTEVVGQAEHFAEHGEFPADQVAFDAANVHRFRPLARGLVFSLAEANDRAALTAARLDPATLELPRLPGSMRLAA